MLDARLRNMTAPSAFLVKSPGINYTLMTCHYPNLGSRFILIEANIPHGTTNQKQREALPRPI